MSRRAGHIPAFDDERAPLGQGERYLPTGLGDDALECRARDAHAPGRCLLAQVLQVDQAQRLQFLRQKENLPQVSQRDPGGLVNRRPRHPGDESLLAWAWHEGTMQTGCAAGRPASLCPYVAAHLPAMVPAAMPMLGLRLA